MMFANDSYFIIIELIYMINVTLFLYKFIFQENNYSFWEIPFIP